MLPVSYNHSESFSNLCRYYRHNAKWLSIQVSELYESFLTFSFPFLFAGKETLSSENQSTTLLQEMATASATASNVLLSTIEKENYLRIARLLIVGGTELMRNVFDKFHPPSSLSIKLADPATKRQLMATLMKPQRDCVYPAAGVCGESKDFDISLLSRLLKTICPSLPPVLTGWDHLPNSTDLSVTADIVRIKVYRNDISHKYHNMEISDGQFYSLWNEIKKALIRIADFINTATRGKWEQEIDGLLTDPLTPEAEKNARELYEWHLKDMDVKECTERLQTELRESSEGIAQRMEEGVEYLEREFMEEQPKELTKELDD